jgi:hypothetical protein
MRRNHAAPLALIAASARVVAPSAGAKLGLSFAVSPTRPVAGEPAQVTLRAAVVLPRKHDIRLTAVGAWRGRWGQTVFDIPLVRTRPRVLRATVRFPHGGRWSLIVPGEPSAGWSVRVQPRR